MKRNCRMQKKEQNSEKNKKKKTDDQNTTTIVVDESEKLVVLSFVENHSYVTDSNTEWVINFAASYYTTPKRDAFIIYKVDNFGRVKMGNTNFTDIVGIGDICVQTYVECTLTLKNVRHVPDLYFNLISINVLDLYSYYNIFGGRK